MYIDTRGRITPEKDWHSFPVEHLHLPPRVNASLRRDGVRTVGDALRCAASGVDACPSELVAAFRQIQRCDRSGELDWREYWRLRENRFEQLAAAHPDLDLLAEKLAHCAVDRRSLGNAGAMLQASGIRTFPDLVAGLRRGLGSVRGIGRTKIAELFDRLFGLISQIQRGGIPKANFLPDAECAEGAQWSTSHSAAEPAEQWQLSDDARRLPISILQLGVKSRWLHSAGYRTVGDLADCDLRQLSRLKAVGGRTVKVITASLKALERATSGGTLDWRSFAEHSGLPFIPESPLSSAREMLERLPEIIEAIAPHLRDDSYRAILSERLTKGPGAQLKLEELARKARPPVTRERIRQKEKKLLRQLAGALIWDVDGQLGVQFHPTLLNFWRAAAAEFEGEEEIGFDEFVSRLAFVWKVESSAIVRELPFIFSIVTGDPQLPANFRAAARLDPRFFRLHKADAAIPLGHLRLGKQVERLARRGATDLGSLIEICARGLANEEVRCLLDLVSGCIGSDGRFCWDQYASAAELSPLPMTPARTPEEFVSTFADEVSTLLSKLHRTDRRPRIFLLRTSQPLHRRPTLDAVSKVLVTHGPTVKREETLLLEELHDILVDRDFSFAPVWLDQSWLDFISEAKSAYDSSGRDFATFQSQLSQFWGMPVRDVERAAPALWAIFTGYPEGRKRRRTAGKNFDERPVEPARIRLRGFRRVH